MLNTLGIVEVQVQARAAPSASVDSSLASRRFGGQSLLEWVVRRVSESLLLDSVIVVSDLDARGRSVSHLAPPNVPVFSGRQADPLARFAAALRKYPARSVVRVRVGNPFVDPGLIDKLIAVAIHHPRSDYLSYCSADGRPAVLSHLGLCAEWCRSDAILYADRDARLLTDRYDVTHYIVSHPELFNLRLVPVPPQLDRQDVRLAIQVEEDWEHAQAIYEALGPEKMAWQDIASLLDHQPAMRQRMAVLNRADSS